MTSQKDYPLRLSHGDPNPPCAITAGSHCGHGRPSMIVGMERRTPPSLRGPKGAASALSAEVDGRHQGAVLAQEEETMRGVIAGVLVLGVASVAGCGAAEALTRHGAFGHLWSTGLGTCIQADGVVHTRLTQGICSGPPFFQGQRWVVGLAPGGTLTIRLAGTSLCVDVPNGTPASGLHLQLFPCALSQINQRWTMSNGTIGQMRSAVPGSSGLCVDIEGGLATVGAELQFFPCWPPQIASNQTFFTRLGPIPTTLVSASCNTDEVVQIEHELPVGPGETSSVFHIPSPFPAPFTWYCYDQRTEQPFDGVNRDSCLLGTQIIEVTRPLSDRRFVFRCFPTP